MSIEREMNAVSSAFWPEFRVREDALNSTVEVWGPVEELYQAAVHMRATGLFSGFIWRAGDHIKIRLMRPFSPPRDGDLEGS